MPPNEYLQGYVDGITIFELIVEFSFPYLLAVRESATLKTATATTVSKTTKADLRAEAVQARMAAEEERQRQFAEKRRQMQQAKAQIAAQTLRRPGRRHDAFRRNVGRVSWPLPTRPR